VPDQAEPDSAPKYLDAQELSTPVVALASATREVLGVGDLIERMLIRVSEAIERNDASKLAEIPALEERVDRLQQAVKVYLSKLGREGLSDENARRSIVVIDYAINLEHMGDIIEKGLLEQVAKKISLGLKFSEDGHQELRKLFDLTIDNLRVAQTIFVTRDFNLARQMMEVKVEVRRMEKQSAERHLERLRDGRADSLQTSSLHLDMLRDLKRINAHIVSVAHPILDESGLLIESRLRDAARGDSDACYELGMVYSSGTAGIDVDLIEAHKWFNLAAVAGSEEAQACRSEIAEDMSAREIAEAQRAARAWLNETGRRAA
jgi:phosphate:Na+ symporter